MGKSEEMRMTYSGVVPQKGGGRIVHVVFERGKDIAEGERSASAAELAGEPPVTAMRGDMVKVCRAKIAPCSNSMFLWISVCIFWFSFNGCGIHCLF